jgi:hypothetical protein
MSPPAYTCSRHKLEQDLAGELRFLNALGFKELEQI